MRNQTDSEVWNSYLLKSRFPKCSLVIDGDSLANNLYHSQINRGLAFSHNPLNLYNMARKIIGMLKGYNLQVIKVYIDALSNINKKNTYLSRRKDRILAIKKWWDSDLTNKGRDESLLLCRAYFDTGLLHGGRFICIY